MKGKTRGPSRMSDLDLFSFPHVVDDLTRLFKEGWQPEPEEFARLENHIATCTLCLENLSILLLANKGTQEQAILNQLKEILHGKRLLEDLSGYADTLERLGRRAARKEYPRFAEHVKLCKVCQKEVEITRKLIREADKDGLLVPAEEASRR
ncbi:MAG TPA: hypothetical protein VFA41_14790 [Ktedonobacteraceae bacterium]|nr:hypothetical protein [Ktedonobacteraceae bacterium]